MRKKRKIGNKNLLNKQKQKKWSWLSNAVSALFILAVKVSRCSSMEDCARLYTVENASCCT